MWKTAERPLPWRFLVHDRPSGGAETRKKIPGHILLVTLSSPCTPYSTASAPSSLRRANSFSAIATTWSML